MKNRRPLCQGAGSVAEADNDTKPNIRVPRRHEPPTWSRQQRAALSEIKYWYTNGANQTFPLPGYAGTGKTSLAHEIASRVGGRVVYAAPTGRAAAVMRSKGCGGADTLDSLIYTRKRIEYCADETPCETVCADRCRYKRE